MATIPKPPFTAKETDKHEQRPEPASQNGTDVPSRRREQSAVGPICRRPPHDAGSGSRVPADLAHVRLQAGGDRPSGALHAGDHARTRAVKPLAAGVDCRLYLGAQSLSVLTEISRRGRGGSVGKGERYADRRRGVRRQGDSRSGNLRSQRSEEHTSELQSLRHLVCRLLVEKTTTSRTTENAPVWSTTSGIAPLRVG